MTAHAIEKFPRREPAHALARVELRKMADTRAGFWLLLDHRSCSLRRSS